MSLNFRPNFVTAGANTGTNGDVKVTRGRAKLREHPFNDSARDGGRGATPSRMDGCYGVTAGVDEQQGNAISSTDCNCAPRLIRNQRIAFRLPIAQALRIPNTIGVN